MTTAIRKAFLLLILIFTTALFAADPKLKDYPEAQELEQKAENGDIYAMYNLAEFYDSKIGDEKKAIYWFTKNCGKWDKECVYSIGFTYRNSGNRDKAKVWLEKAYKMGSAKAAYELGELLTPQYEGEEDDEWWDYEAAVKWLKIADKGGVKEAASALGGLVRDFPERIMWLEKAYRFGDKYAAIALISCYAYIDKFEKAIEWYKIARKIEIGNYAYLIADQYKSKNDRINAVKWYEIDYNDSISNKDKSEAARKAYELGNTYEAYKDYPNAIKWFEISYNSGSASAAFALGLIYERELKDYPKAIEWYQIASNRGSETARKNLNELNKKLSQESNSTIPTDLNSSK